MKFDKEISREWDFRNEDTKLLSHGYHNYPAMMIPQIARKLLEEYSPKDGVLQNVFDPYMGSGTTLVECQRLGVKSVGTDINPLARFISRVKTTRYDFENLVKEVAKLELYLKKVFQVHDQIDEAIDLSHITNMGFWYTTKSIQELKVLTYYNKYELNPIFKDFFDLALAECVREVSFTRNGEFKRYRMPADKLEKWDPDVYELFFKKMKRNISYLSNYLSNTKDVEANIFSFNTINKIPSEYENEVFDMIVTSPPYGDSRTTVAYGQFSRWANEWFDFKNAKSIDKILMGGTIREGELQSQSISDSLKEIKSIDEKRYLDVESFLLDYQDSMRNVAKATRRGGRICYVVGNRRVKGVEIELDQFTAEVFSKNDCTHIETIIRQIPSKRMPSKNSPTNKAGQTVTTMNNEYIVIMEKN